MLLSLELVSIPCIEHIKCHRKYDGALYEQLLSAFDTDYAAFAMAYELPIE